MSRSPTGPPPPPAAQKLRLRYAKRGRLRFTSHRDFQRAFTRALRRAGVPVAHSAGFSPHPRISYAGAASTGVSSEAEYLEVALTRRVEPVWLREVLDASLPAGLDVLEVVESRTAGFTDRLGASMWQLRLPGVEPVAATRAVEAFLAAEAVQVRRLTKNGIRTFDARGPVVDLAVVPPAGEDGGGAGLRGDGGAGLRGDGGAAGVCVILRLVVRHVVPAVRPDDVLTGLRQVADLVPPTPPLVTRLAQGSLDGETGAMADPLAPDRAVASTADEARGAPAAG